MSQERPTHYNLEGVKEVDRVLHVPLFEIAKLGELYPDLTLQELTQLIKAAIEDLKSDSAMMKRIPKIKSLPHDKKSLLDRLFSDGE